MLLLLALAACGSDARPEMRPTPTPTTSSSECPTPDPGPEQQCVVVFKTAPSGDETIIIPKGYVALELQGLGITPNTHEFVFGCTLPTEDLPTEVSQLCYVKFVPTETGKASFTLQVMEGCSFAQPDSKEVVFTEKGILLVFRVNPSVEKTVIKMTVS